MANEWGCEGREKLAIARGALDAYSSDEPYRAEIAMQTAMEASAMPEICPEMRSLQELRDAVQAAEQWLLEAMGDEDRWAVDPILKALEGCRDR